MVYNIDMKNNMTREEVDKLVLQERAQREESCAREFDAMIKQLLEKHRCDLDVQTTFSGQGISHRFVFFAR